MAENEARPSEGSDEGPSGNREGAGGKRRLRFAAPTRTAAAIALGVVLVLAFLAWRHFSGQESTDDAQVEGHVNPVAARVAGPVLEVLVADNQRVEKGSTLVRIDPRDYEIAVARAEADLAQNEAEARAATTAVPMASTATTSDETAASSDLAGAEARLAAARARLREAEAKDAKATQDLARIKPLIEKDEVSRQEYDTAVTTADGAHAARDSAQADIQQAERAVEASRARLARAQTGPEEVKIQKARAASASAKADQMRAALAQARLNLEHTEVKAPVSGVVSRRAVEVGQVVLAGQPLLAIVPLDDVWVVANFKEDQLRRIRPGQRASISVDAYGGRRYEGRVDSVSAATGARFSLLPPENASGNFVKVVQRVPVKITFEGRMDPDHPLRPGMSVVPTVFTR
jgi:membrane fusion protein (multidrug efflux system)